MSSIKLKHSGGNGVSIAPPDTNPASDKTVKLPATNGTLLTTDSSPSFRNLFNNGACRIGQRPSTSLTSGYGGVDRWYQYLSGGVTTTSKDTDVPTGQGFSNSIKLDVTTLLASGSSNWAWVGQYIEAQDVQSVCKGTSNAKQLTLQFWVKSPKTGTHTVRLDCQDSSDGVGATYSVSSADTWEKKTVTFPASTSGAITNDNGRGIQVLWVLSAGTNYSSGTLNTTWASWTNANAAPSQPNILDNTSNNFYLTGVQLEVGEAATEFEHRSYGDELARCQRYCWRFGGVTTAYLFDGIKNSTTAARVLARFPVAMRAVPTITYNNLSCDSEVNSSYKAVSAVASTALNKDYGGKIQFTHAASSGDTGDPVLIYPTDTAGYVQGEAEL